LVRATYTQELAVVVEPAPPAAPGPWFENKQN
jgi:hypothetical protein